MLKDIYKKFRRTGNPKHFPSYAEWREQQPYDKQSPEYYQDAKNQAIYNWGQQNGTGSSSTKTNRIVGPAGLKSLSDNTYNFLMGLRSADMPSAAHSAQLIADDIDRQYDEGIIDADQYDEALTNATRQGAEMTADALLGMAGGEFMAPEIAARGRAMNTANKVAKTIMGNAKLTNAQKVAMAKNLAKSWKNEGTRQLLQALPKAAIVGGGSLINAEAQLLGTPYANNSDYIFMNDGRGIRYNNGNNGFIGPTRPYDLFPPGHPDSPLDEPVIRQRKPTVREKWEQRTGLPWSAAPTNGSYADNVEIGKMLDRGEFDNWDGGDGQKYDSLAHYKSYLEAMAQEPYAYMSFNPQIDHVVGTDLQDAADHLDDMDGQEFQMAMRSAMSDEAWDSINNRMRWSDYVSPMTDRQMRRNERYENRMDRRDARMQARQDRRNARAARRAPQSQNMYEGVANGDFSIDDMYYL